MRTVVFRTGSLGDTVCAVPAFRALRRQYESDELVLLHDIPIRGRVSAADVVRGMGVFDRLAGYRSGRGWVSRVDLALRVRALKPDRIVCLPQRMEQWRSLVRKKRLLEILGVPEVLGFADPKRFHGAGLTESRRLLALLEVEGLCSEHLGYGFPVDSLASVRVLEWIAGRRQDRGVVVFCGGGKTPSQRWSLNRYGELLRGLTEVHGAFVVGVGTPSERDKALPEVLSRVPGMEWMPAGWGVLEMLELMRGADLYVGNDTGPMHVAAAMGCPVFAVMSARNLAGAWDPDLEARCVLRLPVECEGCFLEECRFPGQPCLDGIGVEHAWRELQDFVAERGVFGSEGVRSEIWGHRKEGGS
jgi:heptosyltransferase-3